MIARMVADHGIDPRRIYITGLSAGGAMTSVMLATYPEVFAAGAIIAGLPFGVASNVREALSGMMQSTSRPAGELGDLVRKRLEAQGPVAESVGVARQRRPHRESRATPTKSSSNGSTCTACRRRRCRTGDVDGYPREVWWNADGETVVESYTITDMAHGTPLGLAGNDERYGAEGAFLIEAGISSSYHIANFFGLTERVSQASEAAGESGGRAEDHSVGRHGIPAVDRCRRHALVASQQTGSPDQPGAARTEAPRHRCRRRHHPRPDGRGTDEIAAPALRASSVLIESEPKLRPVVLTRFLTREAVSALNRTDTSLENAMARRNRFTSRR